jgi:predicted Zn-dependent protease
MCRWLFIFSTFLIQSTVFGQAEAVNSDTALQSLLRQQKFHEAAPLLRYYVDQAPEDIALWEQIAEIYIQTGQTASARYAWETILRLDSTHRNGLYQLGLIHLNAEDYIQAEICFDKLVTIEPEHTYYLKMQARIKSLRNKSIEAFSAYASAHRINPNDLDVIRAIAEIFHANEQYHESDSLIAAGLRLDPDHFKLRKMQIETCYSLQYYEHTMQLLEELKETPYFNNYFRRMLSICYIQDERYSDALKVLKTIEEPDQNEEYTYFYLSKAYLGLGNKILARHWMQKTIETCKHPNEGKYWYMLANILIEAEMYTQAKDAYLKSRTFLDDPMLVFLAARAADAGEKYSEASSLYVDYIFQFGEKDAESIEFAKKRIEKLKPK